MRGKKLARKNNAIKESTIFANLNLAEMGLSRALCKRDQNYYLSDICRFKK
jgi:hypothetical protein